MNELNFPKRPLGHSDLHVQPICLGTMTFGEQVDEATAHAILDRSIERGVDFIDTAEMYAVPTRRETYGATETIIGNWLARRPGIRQRIVLATKVAGPSRGMDWIRNGSDNLKHAEIIQACDDSLRRLQTDVIDLYQIHWPNRNTPAFGALYLDPSKDRAFTSIQVQLEALDTLVKAGKVRHIGLSNETPWGCLSSCASRSSRVYPGSSRCRTPMRWSTAVRTTDWTRPCCEVASACWPTAPWGLAH